MDEVEKKEIVDDLKEAGMELLEESVMASTKKALALIKIILPKVIPSFAGIIIPIIEIAEPKIYEYIDKIDGECDLCKEEPSA